jgi:hypothetical protein
MVCQPLSLCELFPNEAIGIGKGIKVIRSYISHLFLMQCLSTMFQIKWLSQVGSGAELSPMKPLA